MEDLIEASKAKSDKTCNKNDGEERNLQSLNKDKKKENLSKTYPQLITNQFVFNSSHSVPNLEVFSTQKVNDTALDEDKAANKVYLNDDTYNFHIPGIPETSFQRKHVQFNDKLNPNKELENFSAVGKDFVSENNDLDERNSPQKKKQKTRKISESSNYSSCSLGSTSSSSESAEERTPPDGGWGWVVVFASFIVNMIADGVTFSFGVFYIEFLGEFGESRGKTAWLTGIFHAVPLLAGPIASSLTDLYGCKKVTIFGSLLAAFGFFISTFVHRLELLFITFGLITGFGLSLCYVAAVVIVVYYFEAKRSFATGISVCGSGVGTFLFAPFIQYLIDAYGGWRSACLILSAIFLNMCACGLLMRDLPWIKRKRKRPRSPGSVSSYSGKSQTGMPDIEELKLMLENGDVDEANLPEQFSGKSRLTSSLLNLPTFIHNNQDQLSPEVLELLSKNKIALKTILESYPNLAIDLASNSREDNRSEVPIAKDENGVIMENNAGSGVKLKRKVSSIFKKRKELHPILKKTTAERKHSQFQINDDFDHEKNLSDTMCLSDPFSVAQKESLLHLKVRRQSLTYRGAMLNISKYKLKASSCPDIYQNSISDISEERSQIGACKEGFLKYLHNFLQWNFMKPGYIFFVFSNFILYAWYDVPYVNLADNAVELGYSENDSAFLISVVGLLNTIGEVVIGYFGDHKGLNTTFLYVISIVVCGIVTFLIPNFTSYYILCTIAGIYGFFISANYSLTSAMLVNLISLEEFPNAYGLLLLFQGISNLIGPPIAGFLYDFTGDWFLTFYLAGTFIVFSGVSLLLVPAFLFIKNVFS